jgi:hypothetical protein
MRDIYDAQDFQCAAQKQGVSITEKEADVILGYLEGHEYCLLTDEDGTLYCHDLQYGCDYSEDIEDSVRNIARWCYMMNDDLLQEDRGDKMRYLELKRDEIVLYGLLNRIDGPWVLG